MDEEQSDLTSLQERSREARTKQERANKAAEQQQANLTEFMKSILIRQGKLHKDHLRLSEALASIETAEQVFSALLASEVVSMTGLAKLFVDQQDEIKRQQELLTILDGRNKALKKKVEALGAMITSLESR